MHKSDRIITKKLHKKTLFMYVDAKIRAFLISYYMEGALKNET